MTINEMLDCWNNETNEPDSMEWREDLTEYQRKLVEIWDEQYDLRIARMVRDTFKAAGRQGACLPAQVIIQKKGFV